MVPHWSQWYRVENRKERTEIWTEGGEKAKGGKKERKRDWDITCQVDYRMM